MQTDDVYYKAVTVQITQRKIVEALENIKEPENNREILLLIYNHCIFTYLLLNSLTFPLPPTNES